MSWGNSRKSGALIKNSIIKCTLDDLQLDEGLLVVSFTHKDNLYQGVLLQLNRERGIPAGISFPKDYFSEEKKPIEPGPPSTPVPPINQRHTYFQEVDNGSSQLRSLRRVIKTPARFKNSRMSLRPVQRPVLCAKCGALCNEKTNNSKNATKQIAAGGGGEGDVVKPKKNGETEKSQGASKITTTKEKLVQSPTKVKVKLYPDTGIPPVVENPEADYNYEGVGSKGVVENAWKRPLAKPLKCQTKQQSVNKNGTNNSKPSKSSGAHNLHQELQNNESGDQAVFRITKAPPLIQSTKRKVNNLKMCIRKLTMAHDAKIMKTAVESVADNMKADEEDDDNQDVQEESNNKDHSVPPVRMKLPLLNTATKLKLRRRNSSNIAFNKNRKPPTWRTRKISTMSDTEEKMISSNESCDSEEPLTVTAEDNRVEDFHKNQMPLLQSTPLPQPHLIPSAIQSSIGDLSPISSPEHFDSEPEETNGNSGQLGSEPVKTPVIKITFGSCGNGVVLQIPPKDTNHHHYHHDQGDREKDSEAKAARKAMKKAKKEAKKKHLLRTPSPPPPSIDRREPILGSASDNQSSEQEHGIIIPPCPSLSPTRIALMPSATHPNNTDHHEANNPEESIMRRHSRQSSSNTEENVHNNIEADSSSCTADHETMSERSIKKKKKAKKRKRQKDHKENDMESSGEGGESRNLPGSGPPDQQLSLASSPDYKSEPLSHPNNSPKRQRSLSISRQDSAVYADSTASSDMSNHTHRVCISLKRIKNKSNMYVSSWNNNSNSLSSDNDHENEGANSDEEPHEFQDTAFQSDGETVTGSSGPDVPAAESIEFYNHEQSSHQYRTGDVVWGKSIGCPWWPGKIIDIQIRGENDARAKIAWYKSTTQSFIAFNDLYPFQEYFETKYTKNRKRGSYQQAVREALSDAHQENLQDFATD